MEITPKEKTLAIEREYGEIYDGIQRAIEAKNYPEIWGLSSERSSVWGYKSPNTVESLTSLLYDELANLGRFGEDARKENHIFQYIQDGDYKILKEMNENVLRRFVSTYGVLMWALIVSSDNEKQKNIIRVLFLLYGTIGEKKAALIGIKKLSPLVINAVNDMETAKLVVDVVPSSLKRGPITADNYLDKIGRLSRFEALALVAKGEFLADKPELRKGILTAYFEHIKGQLAKEYGTGSYAANSAKHDAFKYTSQLAHILAPTGIIYPEYEDYEILGGIIRSLIHPAVHWDEYNKEMDPNRMFNLNVGDIFGLASIFGKLPTNIASNAIDDVHESSIRGPWILEKLIDTKLFDIDIFINHMLKNGIAARVVSNMLSNEKMREFFDPNTSEKGALVWTLAALGSVANLTKRILDYWAPSWEDISKALRRIVAELKTISNSKKRFNYVYNMINIDGLYVVLSKLDLVTIKVEEDALLDILDVYGEFIEEKMKKLAVKLVRFIAKNNLYVSADRLAILAKNLGTTLPVVGSRRRK